MDEHDISNNYTDEMHQFLNALRLSGVTNMNGATPYLMEEFPELSSREARAVLVHWIRTLNSERE